MKILQKIIEAFRPTGETRRNHPEQTAVDTGTPLTMHPGDTELPVRAPQSMPTKYAQPPRTPRLDNDLAHALDPEAASTMEERGVDIRFLGPGQPAYRNSDTGTWSRCVWDGGGPAGTVLAFDFDTLVSRVQEFERYREEGRLEEWREAIYLPQRAEVVFGSGLKTNDIERLKSYAPQS